mmetsp:Transcript_26499/g.62269  ORF Transcript_26499/g.62269 Transcript_26499/m.62269 type:complete len:86 (+) Transcript_26499:1847-2104(+)
MTIQHRTDDEIFTILPNSLYASIFSDNAVSLEGHPNLAFLLVAFPLGLLVKLVFRKTKMFVEAFVRQKPFPSFHVHYARVKAILF